jgi:hypothetical protein
MQEARDPGLDEHRSGGARSRRDCVLRRGRAVAPRASIGMLPADGCWIRALGSI